MRCRILVLVLLSAIGCGESKYTTADTDPQKAQEEQEKLNKQMQDAGEQRVGTFDVKNSRDPEQVKLEKMMTDSGEERPGMPLPKSTPPAKK